MQPKQVYLDNNATTPLHPEVKTAMANALDLYGNPSSFHQFGREARAEVEKSREMLASFINAASSEIIFTGSGSEANNAVLSLVCCSSKACSHSCDVRHGIITTSIEHPCILETTRCLMSRGAEAQFLPVNEYGRIDLEDLKSRITENTALVSVMMVNNEIGTIQDIRAISEIAHEHGALLHTDAVQGVGKIPVDVQELGVDFLTVSAHKMYGPKGVGALYVRTGMPYCPFIRGGHQEHGRRAGTENTLGIIGLGKAVEMRKIELMDEYERLRGYNEFLRKQIEKNIPGIKFNGHPEHSVPHTLNVSFQGAEGEAILLYLDTEGIAISTGSACASGSLDPSHVLLATGLTAEYAHGSVRISMGRTTTMEDLEYFIEKLTQVIAKIRGMSSTWQA